MTSTLTTAVRKLTGRKGDRDVSEDERPGSSSGGASDGASGRASDGASDRVSDQAAEQPTDRTDDPDSGAAQDERNGEHAGAAAGDADESGADASQPAETSTARPGARRRVLTAVAVMAAIVIGVSGALAWWSAATSEDLEVASDRDAVLVAAKQGIATLNTLDYRDIDGGLEAWVDASTGTLRDQLAGVGEQDRQLLADQQKISTGTVLDAAVVDLDETTATVLAAVEVEVVDGADAGSDAGADPAIKRNRFTADMVAVEGGWKIESLQQVAVNVS